MLVPQLMPDIENPNLLFIPHTPRHGEKCCLCNNRVVSQDWVKHNRENTERMHRICVVQRLLNPTQDQCPGCRQPCDKSSIFSWQNKIFYKINVNCLNARRRGREFLNSLPSTTECIDLFMHYPISNRLKLGIILTVMGSVAWILSGDKELMDNRAYI